MAELGKIRKIRKNGKGRRGGAIFSNNSIILMLICVQNFVNLVNSGDFAKKPKHFERISTDLRAKPMPKTESAPFWKRPLQTTRTQ